MAEQGMSLREIMEIHDETQRVDLIYRHIFHEEGRLSHSQAARVEFLTTLRVVEENLRPSSRILDLGAGTGAYSLYLANKGHQVSAVELAERNVEIIRKRVGEQNIRLNLHHTSALDLSFFEDESFDAVLLMGPLYHLSKETDRTLCVREARRVLKNDGRLFAAFINHDMIPYTESAFNPAWFEGNTYDHQSLRVYDEPFVFFTLAECRAMLRTGGLDIRRELTSDGLSELMADTINRMSEAAYWQYLRWHHHMCEQPSFLSAGNHLLFETVKA